MANRTLAAPTPSLMIPRRTLLKAAGLAAAATIIRPAFADSELDSLYAKARKEGGLNLYGGGPADWYTQWAKQFEAAFPGVPIAFTGGFSNQLSPKIDKQIANKKLGCDVAVLQTLQDFERWKHQGALTILPNAVFEHIDRRYYDPGKTFTGVSLYTLSYVYNPSLLGSAVPVSAEDFLNSAYRDKVITVYPQTDDVTLFLYWTIVSEYGWQWMKDYMVNKPSFVKGHLGVAQAVDQGKSAASFDTITELSVAQPGYDLAVRVAFSKVDPSPYWPQSAAIFRNCPHPAAAELFLRWSLGKEQQRAMNRKGVWTVRDDVDPSTVRLIGKPASITSYRGSAACGFLSGRAISGEAGRRRELLRSASTGDVDEGDLLVARSVEAHNRFRRRLQDHATTLLVKIRARFRR